VETGHTATTWRLTGEFAFEGEIPTAGGSTADLGETVDIEARLGVWHGTDVLVAGGAHPAEPLIETIDEALPNLIDAETAIGAVADAEAADALATESIPSTTRSRRCSSRWSERGRSLRGFQYRPNRPV